MLEVTLLNVNGEKEETTMFREHRKINVKLLYNLVAFYVNGKSTRTHQDSHGVFLPGDIIHATSRGEICRSEYIL